MTGGGCFRVAVMKNALARFHQVFSSVARRAPPGTPGSGACCKAAGDGRGVWNSSTQPREERGNRQRQQPKRQMAPHLVRPAHPHPPPAIAFLEPAVDPLG